MTSDRLYSEAKYRKTILRNLKFRLEDVSNILLPTILLLLHRSEI